ncbi:MAG: helix-turn-helix domain-containing protein [gamma proteobacterium symbiont of Bathyaustriella thionipta]|nr:helix-turn-helix domain-containing protein [gamma proteobacterium symbiont of Bathyaustriella thionipta]
MADQDEAFQKAIGEIVRTNRVEKGMSKKELGLKLGYAKNSAGQVISKIESGKISIPQKKLPDLIKILGITHEILGITDTSIPLVTLFTSATVAAGAARIASNAASLIAGATMIAPTAIIGAGMMYGMMELFKHLNDEDEDDTNINDMTSEADDLTSSINKNKKTPEELAKVIQLLLDGDEEKIKKLIKNLDKNMNK